MRQLISAIVWAFIGALVAVALTAALTGICVVLMPNDKTAGSVGIILIGLLPIGLIVGAIVGLVRGRKRHD